jgi:DNA-binding response OmpR family regulator
MNMKTILVAEDQTDIRDLLVLNLRSAGYDVTEVADGLAALASHSAHPHDLLVLDLMMPGMDGLELCKTLRARGSSTPILMLTAKSTELDRVLGLELGADDYLTKPFSLAELLARVKALLRRAEMLRAAQAGSCRRRSAPWNCMARRWTSPRWNLTCCCTLPSTPAMCFHAGNC